MDNYVNIKSLTESFQCGICQGYIIDATTISECLHSFCKSCIFHFIESIDHRCPTCNHSLTATENCISFDASLQRLIYQLVPNLLENELDRRQQFQLHNFKSAQSVINENTLLNLKLYNIQNENKARRDSYKLENKKNNNSSSGSSREEDAENKKIDIHKSEIVTVKYFQCLAQTPIRIIARMLRNKYNIPPNYGVRLSHLEHRVNETETLLKLFTCFIKTKDEILDLKYELFKLKLRKPKKEPNLAALSSLTLKNNQNVAVSKCSDKALSIVSLKPNKLKLASIQNTPISEQSTPVINSKLSSNLSNLKKSDVSISKVVETIIFKPSINRKLETHKNSSTTLDKHSKDTPKQLKKQQSDNINNLNETESVYYSDQNYDDDSEEEGKLLIVDTNEGDIFQAQNDNNSGSNCARRHNASIVESPLDLRVTRK